MPADIATQAKGVDDCQKCGKTTTAAWRAHSLRAQAFQKPGRPKTNPSASKASRCRAQHGQTCLYFHALLNWVFGAPGAKSAPWRCRATALLTRWPFLAKQLEGASTPQTTRKPLKLHHPTPGSNRNNSPPKSSVAGHSGPKSGGSSPYKTVLGFVLLQSTAGARVSSTAVVEEGPGLWDLPGPGKQHGQALGSGLTLGSRLTFAAKRAYRRARNRAMTSLEGGTYYKGRWHTQDTLRASAITHHTPVQRNKALRQSPKTSCHPKIRSFSWNTGGLSAPSFQELVAWLDLEDRFEVVILQETHWRDSTDFKSGRWFCIHSSGYASDLSFDRYGGILIMLNSRVFEEPSVQEIYPGRLLHVRAVHKPSYLSVDVLGLYQHVNRTHLSSELNRSYRNQIWEAIDQALNSFPARNPLLLGGDFNAQLTAQRPHVGTTCCQPGEGQDREQRLAKLLKAHALCVLNTWHARPSFTYESAQSKTRIDFIITRLSEARGNAKRATPNYTFPVKAWSVAGHWPVEAEVPVAPFHRRAQQQPSCPNLRFDKIALLPAVQTNNDQAQALQSTVHQELAKIESTELHQVRNSINSALLEAVEKHFPQPKPDDNRLSAQGGFRASAKHTWQLYKEMKAAHTVTAHSVFRQWQATVTFMKASQALRAQSRHLKKASVLHKLAEAETAACKGDQRVLYQIVRSLTPHKHQFLSRLRDSQGRLLDKTASLQAMLQYARDTFSVHADDPAELSMTAGLAITDQAVQQELQKLGAAKAVPFNTAPASVWKYCAGSIAGLLGPALRQHFQAGSRHRLTADLHDAYITLIPKPNKPSTEVANLRPIGLQCPSAKTVAGLLRQSLLDTLLPLIQDLPQYAYAKSRGTFDAILRVHMHFEEVSECLRRNQINRFQQHQGRKPMGCIGGLSLSLDLSQAYDLASRPIIYGTLAAHGVSQDTISAIKQLHCNAQYVFRSGPNIGRHTTTNGLKQGCCIAPFLWSFYTVAVMHTLRDKLGAEWLQQALVLFADDHWCQWVIKSKADFEHCLAQLTVVLETLLDFKMSVNYKKTAILLRLEGKQAKMVLREHTKKKNGETHLCIMVKGQEQLIPVKDTHEHLGTKVTYHHRLDKNLGHRLQSGQAKYQALRKVLNGHHALHVRYRLRLWAACVQTSKHYSLPAVGLTRTGLEKLTIASTKQIRAIQKLPSHLTKTTNTQVWQQAGMLKPGQALLQALRRFQAALQTRDSLAPDITT